MPLFTQNGSLLRAGNSLRGCCCDDIEPPPPPPPPVPPGPEPPPPPIPPGDPPEFGGECCLINADGSDTGRAYCNDDELTIWYGKKNVSLCGGKFVAQLDGDHTCSDSRHHGLRDEYITARFSIGQLPVFDTNGNIMEYQIGSGGSELVFRTWYNRFSECVGDPVDDNARTPTAIRQVTCLQGQCRFNGISLAAGVTHSKNGVPFYNEPLNQQAYCGGRQDTVIPECHFVPPVRSTSAKRQSVPGFHAAYAVVQVTVRLTWYHHDDYDIYTSFRCSVIDDRVC